MSRVATVTLLICLPTVVVAYPVIKGFFVKIIEPRVNNPGRLGTKVYVKKLIPDAFNLQFIMATKFMHFGL